MAWLPSIEERERGVWRKRANARIRFLERFGERAPQLPRFHPERAPGLVEMPQLPAANALTKAAELAFVTDQTTRGRELLDRAVGHLLAERPGNWPITRTALLGTLVHRVSTELNSEGIHLMADDLRQDTSWYYASTLILDRTAGALIAAAVASGPPERTLSLLTQPLQAAEDELGIHSPERLAYLIAAKAMEADTLPLFGWRRRPDGPPGETADDTRRHADQAVAAFLMLTQRYAARVRLLTSDHAHWGQLYPRVPMLDWTLLSLHVALLRREMTIPIRKLFSSIQPVGPAGALGTFIADIASALDRT